jgi:hypothetical protein
VSLRLCIGASFLELKRKMLALMSLMPPALVVRFLP